MTHDWSKVQKVKIPNERVSISCSSNFNRNSTSVNDMMVINNAICKVFSMTEDK